MIIIIIIITMITITLQDFCRPRSLLGGGALPLAPDTGRPYYQTNIN